MKIGLITVFYTENCGSILQATALSDKLKEYGCDVYFISTKNKVSGHSFKRFFKNLLKSIKNKENIAHPIKKYYFYTKYIKKHFKIINYNNKNIDLIVIGSDTVWDITSRYFLESQPLFWGTYTRTIPKISYAASIANSSYNQLDKLLYPIEALKEYKAISVRDYYTKEYVESRTGQNAKIVCDPTLLHEVEYYTKKCINIQDSKFLLLYLFDEPTQEIKEEITNFAKEKSLNIICLKGLGKCISFADKYVESTIDNFLSYFYKADYIVTNTFHGTIFSIIFNKNFVVLDYNKNKITLLLEQLNLSERLIIKDIKKKFNKNIEYKDVNSKLNEMKKNGEEYLKEQIL